MTPLSVASAQDSWVNVMPEGYVVTGTTTVNVTIEWCGRPPHLFDPNTRVIRLNSVDVSANFTTQYVSDVQGCLLGQNQADEIMERSTGTIILTSSASHLEAWVFDINGYMYGDNEWYLTTLPERGVTVTADAQAAKVPPSTAGLTQKFTVWNVGEIQDTFVVTPSCSGVAAGGSCGVSPGSIALSPTASGSITVTYTSKALGQIPGDTGLIRLAAYLSSNPTKRDSSWTDVTLAPPPPAGAVLFSSGSTLERDLCVTMALGSGAASECGDLRLVHPLAATRTLNRAWAPMLLYNSQHANPAPIVQADVTLPTGTTDSVQVRLLIVGVERGKGRWPGWAASQTRRVAVMDTTGSLAEGIYSYTLEVRRKSGGTWSTLATPTGTFSVVRRDASPFGAGWWLAGLERLNLGNMMWTGGEGSVRQYTSAGTNLWVAPNVDHPDTLKLEGSYYVRYVRNNLRVKFNTSGQHVQTINRLGQITVFGYDNCGRLSVIKLAPDTVSRVYLFSYSSPTDCATRLASVTAPPIGGTARVTTLTNTSGQVTSLRDPDNATVSFGYQAGTNRVISRTDRRSKITTYGYDAGKRVSAFRMPVWTADVVLKAAESRGLAPFGAAPLIDSAYAMIDGPRTDVTDVTKFWVNAYGAPIRIRNAALRETQLTYDGTWPALVVKVRAPNFFTTLAWYNARALLDSTKALNPLGDGRNAKTIYTWHVAWAMPTNVTSPSGVITNFGYDASNGNRLWQELGSSAHRVNFTYNSQGQVLSVTQPGLPSESLFYDALGNLHRTKSALGFMALSYADAIGRDTLVATPITVATAGDTMQAFVSWGRTRTIYDIMGRAMKTVTWGPQVTAPGGRVHAADSVRVENGYDLEGNLTATTRFYPAGGFFTALGSSWTYDDANRLTRETSSGHALETVYTLDVAGNRTTVTTARGLSITTQYDAMNRPVKRISPQVNYSSTSCTVFVPPGVPCIHTFPTRDGPDVCIRGDTAVFGYDHVGNAVRADNWAALVRRAYAPSGLLQEDTLRIRSYRTSIPGASPCEPQNPDTLPVPTYDFDWHIYAIRSAYNLDGQRDTLHHPNDIDPCASRCRDRFVYEAGTGWLDKMYNAKDSLIDFTYDAAGRQTQVRYPGGASGITIVQAYDADGRPTVRSGFGIYDSLAYDARSKVLAGTAWDANWGARPITVTYNGLGAVVYAEAMNSAAGFEEFRLDALGNRVWHHDVGLSSEYNDRCRNNTIDGLGRLTQITLDLVNCPPPPANYAYEHNSWYDGTGNVSATYGKHNVGENLVYNQALSYYDADEKLRVFNSMDVGNQVYEQYRYDALGRRVFVRSRTTDGTGFGYAERTVWDGSQVLYEIRAIGGDSASGGEMESDSPNGSGQYVGKVGVMAYSHAGGIDRPVTVFHAGVAMVPYVDWRGTPAIGSYMNGTPTTGACPPFPAGRTTVDGEKSGEACTEWWGSLIGAQTDGSGLEYMRNRYYDPRTGRFTQEDPIGLAGGLNLYGFAGGDPVTFSDPFGLKPDTVKFEGSRSDELKQAWIHAKRALSAAVESDPDARETLRTMNLAETSEAVVIFRAETPRHSEFGGTTGNLARIDLDRIAANRNIVRPMTVVTHEFGHAWANATGRAGYSDPFSMGFENALRRAMHWNERKDHTPNYPPLEP